MIGKISEIETMGLVDGPGMRMVVFMSGCKLRCLYCHNPETWTGKNAKEVTSTEILHKYQRNIMYYGKNGGVTFSGGEPLLQNEFLFETIKLLKENNINVAIDTSGVADNFEKVIDLADLIILDIKAIDNEEYKMITGHSIDKFNYFLTYCQKNNKKLWLRQVIVPGINDDETHILKLKKFVSKLKNVERVELLPYHSMAKQKYEKLGIDYKLKEVCDMNKDKCKELEDLLKESV